MLAYDYPILGVFWTMLNSSSGSRGSCCCSRCSLTSSAARTGRFLESHLDDRRDHDPFLGVFIYVIARASRWATETSPRASEGRGVPVVRPGRGGQQR